MQRPNVACSAPVPAEFMTPPKIASAPTSTPDRDKPAYVETAGRSQREPHREDEQDRRQDRDDGCNRKHRARGRTEHTAQRAAEALCLASSKKPRTGSSPSSPP